MQSGEPVAGAVADAQRGNWVDRHAPEWLKPYARLARWDRPVPLLLLFWPCGFGLALAALADPGLGFDLRALVLFLVGSVVMRGAGCTFNDIVDRDIDAMVERTRSRPIPSGQVSVENAFIFMALQALIGSVVLFQFNLFTIALGIASLALVAIYPFMKRVTWWPQFFLGLAFNWGVLLGWASQTGDLSLAPLVFYAGSILWTIGYDTIYALQDIEDDALIGVRSTARLFGRRSKVLVALFYGGAVLLWAVAAVLVGAGPVFGVVMIAAVALLAWQVATLDGEAPGNPLLRFRSNHWVGVAVTLALVADRLL